MKRLLMLLMLAIVFAGFWIIGVMLQGGQSRVNNWNRPAAYFDMLRLAHHTQLMWAETGVCPGSDADEPWDADFTAEYHSWTENMLNWESTRVVIDGVIWYEDELGRFTYEVERDSSGTPVRAVWRHLGMNGTGDGGSFDDVVTFATAEEYNRLEHWQGRGPRMISAIVFGALVCFAGVFGSGRPRMNASVMLCPVVASTLGFGTMVQLESVEPTAYVEGAIMPMLFVAASWFAAIGWWRGWTAWEPDEAQCGNHPAGSSARGGV